MFHNYKCIFHWTIGYIQDHYYCLTGVIVRDGGTGPGDPAAAGPKLSRNPQFQFFAVKHTDSFNKQ